jgi:hypothetical protein
VRLFVNIIKIIKNKLRLEKKEESEGFKLATTCRGDTTLRVIMLASEKK